jgi:hypothetical protein
VQLTRILFVPNSSFTSHTIKQYSAFPDCLPNTQNLTQCRRYNPDHQHRAAEAQLGVGDLALDREEDAEGEVTLPTVTRLRMHLQPQLRTMVKSVSSRSYMAVKLAQSKRCFLIGRMKMLSLHSKRPTVIWRQQLSALQMVRPFSRMCLHPLCTFSIVVSLGRATILILCTGSITQWGEVSKGKKDRSRSKAKESTTTTLGESTTGPRTSRGGRAAHEGGRGGRGRGTDRGRGGRGRGGATVHTNGTRAKEASELSVPTEESTAWDTTPKTHEGQDTPETTKPAETWSGASAEAASTTAAAAAKITSSVIQEGVKKSWASMFKPTPPVAPKKEPSIVQKYIYSRLIALRVNTNN